jgi:flagellar hook-associated protein 3 FlgL
MRVTNKMLTSRYTRDLNKSLSNLNTQSQKVDTGRKFFKGSEDPIGAVKAYRLRREYLKNEDYLTNIQEADSIFTSAESNLMGINKNLNSVYLSYLKGINGDKGMEERQIISAELQKVQDSMLTTLNAEFNDKYLFSGASMEQPPFTVKPNASGKNELYYKGVNVSIADNDPAAGTVANEAYDKLVELSKENMYIDIGLSLQVENGKVDPNSVFDLAIPGIKFMNFGKSLSDPSDPTSDKIPNNIYDLITDIREELNKDGTGPGPNNEYSFNRIMPLIQNFEIQKNSTLKEITHMGAKANYLDFIKTRTDDNNINLSKKINDTEFIDPAEAIMDWKMMQYSYTASLQMGTKLIQPSFIDFMS